MVLFAALTPAFAHAYGGGALAQTSTCVHVLSEYAPEQNVFGIRELLSAPNSGWLLTAGVIVFCVGMKSIVAIVRSVAQERTRREIAAFIAEGSMTPEQGERLLKSGTGPRNC